VSPQKQGKLLEEQVGLLEERRGFLEEKGAFRNESGALRQLTRGPLHSKGYLLQLAEVFF